ncbi:nitroreductase family deazaflavin-dependent oxidoreductase [Dactylosporangium sp. NPDC005572]|uniref:nitroreductase family deazaflavin-dependent oxidoreductase n=1 Tax=Dactylosporangium sp. NPDC005572 TaxID=3156889 RepID=UPI0033A790CC
MYDHAQANMLRRLVRRAATSWLVSRLSVGVLHRIDRGAYRFSRRKTTFSTWASGLPVVMLTTTGARTGQSRTTPVLGVPYGNGFVLIASNFGRRRHPAWYHNLRMHPRIMLTVDGVSREFEAYELSGKEREQRFEAAVRMNPGLLNYRSWAGDRQIPVVGLDPIASAPESWQ